MRDGDGDERREKRARVPYPVLARKIGALLDRTGTQRAVEERTGVPQSRLSRKSRHEGDPPNYRDLLHLARGLRVPLDWLLDDAVPVEPIPEPADPEFRVSADERKFVEMLRGLYRGAIDWDDVYARMRGTTPAGPVADRVFAREQAAQDEGPARPRRKAGS